MMMTRIDAALRSIVLATAMAVAGCAMGPKYERPAAELPGAWTGAPPQGVKLPGERWWTLYGDPALDRLVEEALTYNQDLALAAARVDEARAQVTITDSARMPMIDATFERDRSRLSQRTATPLPPGTPRDSNNYIARLNVAYEVDLWGRLSSATRAARADLLSTEAARETVRIAL